MTVGWKRSMETTCCHPRGGQEIFPEEFGCGCGAVYLGWWSCAYLWPACLSFFLWPLVWPWWSSCSSWSSSWCLKIFTIFLVLVTILDADVFLYRSMIECHTSPKVLSMRPRAGETRTPREAHLIRFATRTNRLTTGKIACSAITIPTSDATLPTLMLIPFSSSGEDAYVTCFPVELLWESFDASRLISTVRDVWLGMDSRGTILEDGASLSTPK